MFVFCIHTAVISQSLATNQTIGLVTHRPVIGIIPAIDRYATFPFIIMMDYRMPMRGGDLTGSDRYYAGESSSQWFVDYFSFVR